VPEVDLTIRITGLSGEQLAQFAETPAQIEQLLRTTSEVLEGALAGELPGDALSGLFGTFGTLAADAEGVPGLDAIIGPVRDLIGRLPSADLADAGQVVASIGQFLDIFGPLKDALLSGRFEDRIGEALTQSLDRVSGLVRENEQISQMFGEVEEFFNLFRLMVSWKTTAPDPDELVRFLSRLLVGVGPDVFTRASVALNASLDPLDLLIPPGADLSAWRDLPARQLSLWAGINARLSAGAQVDWPALAAELQAARRLQLEGVAVRDRLLAAALTNLNGFELRGVAEVAAALREIPVIGSVKLQPVFDGLLAQLRTLLAALDSWSPSDADLDLLAQTFADEVVGSLDDTPLGQLRVLVVGFQQRLLDGIEALPFRDIAHEAELALREVADAINVINPEAVRAPLREFMDGIKSQIDAVPAAAVGQSVGALWDRVEEAIGAVSQQLEALTDMLQGAAGTIQGFVESVQPAIDQITQSVAEINVVISGFDLREPAGEVIDALHDIRDTVSRVDVSMLPAPAVAAINAGAEMLRAINLTEAVSGPLNETLAAVDPTPLLGGVTESLAPVVAQLRLIDPASIAAELDKPVDDLLRALERVGPGQLRGLIDEALRPVKDAIRGVDFAGLLAPLTDLYQEINARVGAVLDPDMIFRPLEELYQPVIDAIDALEPTRIIGLIDPHADALGGAAGGAAVPPAALTAGGDALRAAIGSAIPDAADDLFGYRIGDMLVPLIDLHRLLMEVVDGIGDDILEPAARRFHESFAGSLRDLNPLHLTGRIGLKLEAALEEFDPLAVMERLGDATRAYYSAVEKIAGAQASVSAGDRAVSVQVVASLPDLNPQAFVPDLSQVGGFASTVRAAQGRLDLGALRVSFADVGPRFDELLPAFLRDGDLGAGALREALRALDPAPVRDELNRIFDDIGRKLVALEEPALTLLEKLALVVEERVLPLSPANFIMLIQQLHAALRQEVLAFSPATFKDEVKLIFDVVKAQLTVLDPSFIVEELGELREQVLESLDELVAALLPDTAAFDELLVRLAGLKPSQLLAGVADALQPLTDLTALLDPAVMFEPLIAAIANIRADLPDVIADLEAAFDEVLAAFPEGGISGVSASVSVEASAG
jgi:hypothetical protein